MPAPLRVQRFNDHGRHPNPLIGFIKTHAGVHAGERGGEARARAVLDRVAAIVYPVMKANGLQVTTLEEQPFNDSWAGCNWNAGECISLVLTTKSGRNVPERFVLAVMLHELAHCTNMHHGKTFWQTLAKYRAHMAELQSKGYTGEGFWRKGKVLGSGDGDSLAQAEAEEGELPRDVCAGTGRRRRRMSRGRGGRGRKRKWESQGQQLGGDLVLRNQLDGRKTKATPRQANSQRGKDLRAAAAEARLRSGGTKKEESQDHIKDEVDREFDEAIPPMALKTAPDDDEEDDDEEEEEYEEVDDGKAVKVEDEDQETRKLLAEERRQTLLPFKPVNPAAQADVQTRESESAEIDLLSDTTDEEQEDQNPEDPCSRPYVEPACDVCTLTVTENDRVCPGCGSLLRDQEKLGWRCGCSDLYVNHIDAGRCNLCGAAREAGGREPASTVKEKGKGKETKRNAHRKER
ncbi:hypothetical protein PYCC9005_005419 [Savitreella phatthalungensis]